MANPFEIGLVGAGAVSAGAYTAGVLDFLFEALDAWYQAKDERAPDTPPHDVRISVFSGASAGAINGVLTAGFLASDQPPIRSPEDAERFGDKNKFYDTWVNRVDISRLLEGQDLQDGRHVVSLLDSSVLDQVAEQAFISLKPKKRPYAAGDLHLFLTLTNLRGVPYQIKLRGTGQGEARHNLLLHADHAHFCINESGTNPNPGENDNIYYLSRTGLIRDLRVSAKLRQAALASSAFPIGLAPRFMEHEFEVPGEHDPYTCRHWPMPLDKPEGGANESLQYQQIPIECSAIQERRPYQYRFLCADGGVMNNEPLELARRQLAGGKLRNPRSGLEATRAVLMVDPFPGGKSDYDWDTEQQPEQQGLLRVFLSLLTALQNQARFKPDELILASQKDNSSRFMIAPKRAGGAQPAIASAALEGFGGFLSSSFRSHDYFLGRSNARKFLKNYFVLPEGNPLFESWGDGDQDKREAMMDAFCARDNDGNPRRSEAEKQQRLLPIIPLLGDAAEECRRPDWPEYGRRDLEALSSMIEKRLDMVLNRLVDQYATKGHLVPWIIKSLVRRRGRSRLTERVMEIIRKELEDANLTGR